MTSKKRTLADFAELYGLPLGTIANCRRRKWPLNDPQELLRRFMDSPGKKPDLRKLEELACGGVEERIKAREFKAEPDAPHLLQELENLRAETRRSYRDFEEELSVTRRVQLHKVYLANLKALSALIPLAIKAEEEAGRLVSTAGVVQAWTRSMGEFRTTLEQLARRVATDSLFSKLDPVDVEQVITKHVMAALVLLQGGGKEWPQVEDETYTGLSNGADPTWAEYHELHAKFKAAHGGDDTKFTPDEIKQLKAVKRREKS